MGGNNTRWITAFGASLFCHGAALLAVVIFMLLFPAAPIDKGPIEVALVTDIGGGGGGGGGGSEDGIGEGIPEIHTAEATPTSVEVPPDVPEDVPDEAYQVPPSDAEPAKGSAAAGQTDTPGENADAAGNRGHGSGTGSGGGHGSGVGTGTGSGTGPGSGSGSGGGHGSGIGTGTGSGIGPGSGETMGPQILSNPSPAYPESARSQNIEGTVTVGLIISSSGSVTSAWVEGSSGNGALDEAAVNAVYSWQFVPARQNGVAVDAQSRVPVTFRLH